MTVMDERKLLTIKVTPTAKQVVEQTAADRDMKELGVASRIYESRRDESPRRQREQGRSYHSEGDSPSLTLGNFREFRV
jgi:hypothetical protein